MRWKNNQHREVEKILKPDMTCCTVISFLVQNNKMDKIVNIYMQKRVIIQDAYVQCVVLFCCDLLLLLLASPSCFDSLL